MNWRRFAAFGSFALACAGCSSAEPPARQGGNVRFAPVACGVDQVREVSCDGLLPMSAGLGAPEPYSSCPAGIQTPAGAYAPVERVARFDGIQTEIARERTKPGHACCYSWCSAIQTADPADVLPNAGCEGSADMRENFCIAELEAGTSAPGPSPLEKCPIAIRPPPSVSFSVPKAAPLDVATTEERRSAGARECCYGWCSRMPAGMLPSSPSMR